MKIGGAKEDVGRETEFISIRRRQQMEAYECQNCFYTGSLNNHGHCDRCNSNAVVSEQVLSYLLDKKYEELFGEPNSQFEF